MTGRCWPLFDLRLALPELAAVPVPGLALTLVLPGLAWAQPGRHDPQHT